MEETNPYRSLSRRQEKNLLRAADAVARAEFECPERTGCPDSKTLGRLARRHSSTEPSPNLIDHIATCSPCFVEYSHYRAAHKLRVRVSYALASVVAIVFLLVIGRSLYMPHGQPAISQEEIARSPEPFTELVVDLRRWSVFRGDVPERQRNRAPLHFPRRRLSLSIYLPVGSEEGAYEVALVGPSEQQLRTATGEATLQKFVQVLRVKLNLTDVARGLYELRIRREQTPWNTYPVLLE